jgi:hypothetical protein
MRQDMTAAFLPQYLSALSAAVSRQALILTNPREMPLPDPQNTSVPTPVPLDQLEASRMFELEVWSDAEWTMELPNGVSLIWDMTVSVVWSSATDGQLKAKSLGFIVENWNLVGSDGESVWEAVNPGVDECGLPTGVQRSWEVCKQTCERCRADQTDTGENGTLAAGFTSSQERQHGAAA